MDIKDTTSKIPKTALITGASGGIGLAFAKLFAANGYDLVLVARNEDKLKTLARLLEGTAKIKTYVIVADLTRADAPEMIFKKTEELGLVVDVLINNAGSAEYGLFIDKNRDAEISTIEMNVTALVKLTHLYLQGMKVRRSGKILNVASTAAFQPGPLMAVYYATKAFVLSFSEALRNEVYDMGIAITALCPGPTKTDFTKKEPALENSRLFKIQQPASADSVALAGYRGLMKNKAIVIPGFRNKTLAFLTRLGPRWLVTKLSRWVLEK